MDVGTGIDEAVRDLVRARSPLARDAPALADDLRLGAGGLGLDSIAIVELLLDCQRRFGIPAPVELLEGPPLTVGRLAAHVRSTVGR